MPHCHSRGGGGIDIARCDRRAFFLWLVARWLFSADERRKFLPDTVRRKRTQAVQNDVLICVEIEEFDARLLKNEI